MRKLPPPPPMDAANSMYGGACRAEPIDPAVIIASRDGELPTRKPLTGCPTCGCPQFGNH